LKSGFAPLRPAAGVFKAATASCRPHLAAALVGRPFHQSTATEASAASLSKDQLLSQVQRLPIADISAIAKYYNKEEVQEKQKIYPSYAGLIKHRFRVMAEVTVSKIFPAGFGWQAASVQAGNLGYEANSLGFFAITGAGDFAGVLIGHTLFMAGKKAAGFDVDMRAQAETGFLLGSAAFCSGFTWQPTLNALQEIGLSFNQSVVGVGAACALAFFGGLRACRTVYSPFMGGVEEPTYQNLKADAQLSVAIGGATGCFVGTDVSYGDANWLRGVVGIEDGTADMVGQVLAGSSTALGFAVTQTAQNVAMTKGKCWVD